MVICVGYARPVVVHKDIDVAWNVPSSACLVEEFFQLLCDNCYETLAPYLPQSAMQQRLVIMRAAQEHGFFWTLDPSPSNFDDLVEWVPWCLYEEYFKILEFASIHWASLFFFPQHLPSSPSYPQGKCGDSEVSVHICSDLCLQMGHLLPQGM